MKTRTKKTEVELVSAAGRIVRALEAIRQQQLEIDSATSFIEEHANGEQIYVWFERKKVKVENGELKVEDTTVEEYANPNGISIPPRWAETKKEEEG